VIAVLQLECLMSCNLFNKNYKNYMSRVATQVLEELQLKCLLSCNRSAFEELRFEVLVELQLERC
jgi:hypothetical protein